MTKKGGQTKHLTAFFAPKRLQLTQVNPHLFSEVAECVSERNVFYDFCEHFHVVRIFTVFYPGADYIAQNAAEIFVA